jgi:hypothetical protein
MPGNKDKESMNAPDPDPPCTPPKATGNGGAGRVDLDGQTESKDDDDDPHDLQVAKPKRKWNCKMEWTLMKQWVTGQKAEMEQEDLDRELFELAREWMSVSKLREWMSVSKLRKIPGHVAKETDVALCKQFREYPKQKNAILVRLFQFPLRHLCEFLAGIRCIMKDADWMQLDQCGKHNANSHDEDKSKYLMYDAQ